MQQHAPLRCRASDTPLGGIFASAALFVASCGARTELGIAEPADAALSPDVAIIVDAAASFDSQTPIDAADAAPEIDASSPCVAAGSVLRLPTMPTDLDVVVVLEVSGSMEPEITALRAELGAAIPRITARFPEARFTLVAFSEFQPFTRSADRGVRGGSRNAGTVEDLLFGLEHVGLDDGGDAPEAQVIALWLAARGTPFWVDSPRDAWCPADTTVGGACFRDRGARVVVLVTDSPFHNGPGGVHPYGDAIDPWIDIPAPSFEDTVLALREEAIHVVGVTTVGSGEAREHLDAAVRGTEAVVEGRALVRDTEPSGRGIGAAVTSGVLDVIDLVPRRLVLRSSTADVRVRPLRVVSPAPGRVEGDDFADVRLGAELEVTLEVSAPGRRDLFVDVLDRGVARLSRTSVCVE